MGYSSKRKTARQWYGNLAEFGQKIYGKMVEWKFFLLWGLRKKYGKSTETVWKKGGKNMEFVRQGFELQPLGEQTGVLSCNTYVLFSYNKSIHLKGLFTKGFTT